MPLNIREQCSCLAYSTSDVTSVLFSLFFRSEAVKEDIPYFLCSVLYSHQIWHHGNILSVQRAASTVSLIPQSNNESSTPERTISPFLILSGVGF